MSEDKYAIRRIIYHGTIHSIATASCQGFGKSSWWTLFTDVALEIVGSVDQSLLSLFAPELHPLSDLPTESIHYAITAHSPEAQSRDPGCHQAPQRGLPPS